VTGAASRRMVLGSSLVRAGSHQSESGARRRQHPLGAGGGRSLSADAIVGSRSVSAIASATFGTSRPASEQESGSRYRSRSCEAPCLWRDAGKLRSEPKDLSAHESEAADRFRVDDLRVPAVAEKQGALPDRSVLWAAGRAARPAGGDEQGAHGSRSADLLRFYGGCGSGGAEAAAPGRKRPSRRECPEGDKAGVLVGFETSPRVPLRPEPPPLRLGASGGFGHKSNWSVGRQRSGG